MLVYHELNQITGLPKVVLTMGVFDGVHLGHQAVFQYVKDVAAQTNAHSLALTFDKNPLEILLPEQAPKPITTLQEKIELIQKQNIDFLVVLPFNQRFANIPAEEFVRNILVGKIHMQAIVIGHDFRFGKDRLGTFELLKKLGKTHNYTVAETPVKEIDGSIVSSTRIRKLISEHRFSEATNLLGWNYQPNLLRK